VRAQSGRDIFGLTGDTIIEAPPREDRGRPVHHGAPRLVRGETKARRSAEFLSGAEPEDRTRVIARLKTSRLASS
jgi:hypothetical protein